ncbi:MAG: TA system VapC family ribonuclease toxin [Candidatus Sulfotelmatobacter sp.]|jgi:toxin-antitoxin system PIN domain toxin
MPRSSRSFLFPDVNVWIALSYAGHIHHLTAKTWFLEVDMDQRLCFCRFTQLGLLRLLTTEAVMGGDEVMTQAQAWATYDTWFTDSRVFFLEEPANIEEEFRALSGQHSASPKTWSDSYLAAFASVSDLRLVTFDRSLQGNAKHLLILRP